MCSFVMVEATCFCVCEIVFLEIAKYRVVSKKRLNGKEKETKW